jgi:hypothetical protein
MTWLSIFGDLASIAGLIVSAFALVFAKAAKQAAREARIEVRRANAVEVLGRLGDTANLLQISLENNQQGELIVRARDLISEVSRFKFRYERFLDTDSRTRLDLAREQTSVISRSVSSRGMPTGATEKSRMLKICHQDIVAILNEESAKIKGAIEREQE